MSYDVWLSVKTGKEEVSVFNTNHTCNTSGMIYETLCQEDGISFLHHKLAHDCIDPLKKAIHELELNPESFRGMQPDNGWGTVETTIEFLKKILGACEQHYLCTVYVNK